MSPNDDDNRNLLEAASCYYYLWSLRANMGIVSL